MAEFNFFKINIESLHGVGSFLEKHKIMASVLFLITIVFLLGRMFVPVYLENRRLSQQNEQKNTAQQNTAQGAPPATTQQDISVQNFGKADIVAGIYNNNSKPPDRHLNNEYKEKLYSILQNNKNKKTIKINVPNNDSETVNFANEIKVFLYFSAYPVDNSLVIVVNRTFSKELDFDNRDEDVFNLYISNNIY